MHEHDITSENSLLNEQDKDNDSENIISINSKIFSFFNAPIFNKIPDKTITIEEVYELIKSEIYESNTGYLRIIKKEAEEVKYKQHYFPFVTFSALCNHRSQKGVISRSIYFCIDIDYIGDKDAIGIVIKRILKYFAPVLLFISPRGKGLKVVCQINPDAAKHSEYFEAFENYFNHIILKRLYDTKGNPLVIDKSCKDVARATFLCQDLDVMLFKLPTKFDSDFIETFSRPSIQIKNYYSNSNAIIDTAIKMIIESTDGEKHFSLLKASKLAGGGIAGGSINETEAIEKLEAEIKKKPINDFANAQKTIRDGIEWGKKTPILIKEKKFKDKDGENNYLNFPICLISEIFEDRSKVIENIIDYSVYARAIEKESGSLDEKINVALKFLNVPESNIERIKQNGEQLHNSIPREIQKLE